MKQKKKTKPHWEKSGDTAIYRCSNCKEEAYWDADNGQQLFKYCPYCGSEMDNIGMNDGNNAYHHWYL